MTRRPGPATRRAFLRQTASLAAFGAAAPVALNLAALGSAAAQTAGGYKALVCLFLYGGNDAYNLLLPTDASSWSSYLQVRNQAPDPIALRAPGTPADATAAAGMPARLGGVLPITPIDGTATQGRSVALHPLLGGVRDLFAAGRVAAIANVGPLVRPTTQADYRNAAFPKPASLFSHNDQQSTWQSGETEGATLGWGGRLADLLMSANARPLFTSVSASGNAVWLAGRQSLPYQVSTAGAIRIGGSGANTLFGSPVALQRMQAVMRQPRREDRLSRDVAAVVGRSIDAEQLVSASLPSAQQAPYGTAASPDPTLQYDSPLTGARATNPLAQQLQVVARMIGARAGLGAQRQVFFVSLGGFDTHDTQNRTHTDLMARLNHALVTFDATVRALGLSDAVTLFTASDFGRTFTSNGDGTDHGWGAHHLVLGGAVRGRQLYGQLPTLSVSDGRGQFTSPDQLANGVLLPTTSVDQYAATLGRWFGLSDTQLTDVFPRLAHFSQRDLGFMQPG